MARVTKEHDERLNELLDTAQHLFFQKGYDQTSVNAIITAAGIAKGTFYHYFKSKEELLDKMVERFTMKMQKVADDILERNDLNALEKMNLYLNTIRHAKTQNKDLMITLLKVMFKPENLVFREKLYRNSLAISIPLFARFIRLGIEEDLFQADYPEVVAELLMSMAVNLNQGISRMILQMDVQPEKMDEIFELINIKIKTYERSMEKILGLGEGNISFADPEFLEMFKPQVDGK